MKVTIIVNKGAQEFHYDNVAYTLIQQQRGNGNWLFIGFEPGSPEWEEFKEQNHQLPIEIDLRHDQILTY